MPFYDKRKNETEKTIVSNLRVYRHSKAKPRFFLGFIETISL